MLLCLLHLTSPFELENKLNDSKFFLLFFSVLYSIILQMFYYHILHLLNVQLFPCTLCPGLFVLVHHTSSLCLTLIVEVQNSCETAMCSPCKRGLKTKRDETLSLEEKSISISPRHISCNTSLHGAKTSNRLHNLSCCDNRLQVYFNGALSWS